MTGWTFEYIDSLTWPKLMHLLKYWRKHPPMHILVQGIASGLAGKAIGEDVDTKKPKPEKKHVESADELLSLLTSAGIPIGVIQA